MPFKNGDGERVRPHMRFFFACLSDSSKRLTASEQIDLWRHQWDSSDSLFHFHTASDIIYTDGSEDPLMYGVAELLTAQ